MARLTGLRSSVFGGGAAPRNALTGQPDFLITLVTLSLSHRGFGPHSGCSIRRAQRASLNCPALLSRSPGTASRRPGHPRQDWLEDRVALAVAAHVVLPLIPPTTACQYSCRDPTLTIPRWAWNRLAGYGPSTVLRPHSIRNPISSCQITSTHTVFPHAKLLRG